MSAADDNLAIIWNIQLGYKFVVLSGHTRPITDMVVLPSKGDYSQQLLTGSSDKQIRVNIFHYFDAYAYNFMCKLPHLQGAPWFELENSD